MKTVIIIVIIGFVVYVLNKLFFQNKSSKKRKISTGQKSQSSTKNSIIPKPKITSNNSKLNTLIKELESKGHPEYPLLRKEYAVSSGVPYKDFSGWIIEQLKQKDYNSLYAFVKEFYIGKDNSYEKELKINFEKFLTKDFKSLFNNIDEQAIFEIQAFFIIERGIDDFNREFWIAEDKEAELLCKILSVYSFSINPNSFEPLIKRANKFLREMRKDVEDWKSFKNYKIEELKTENIIETSTNILNKLKQLNPGERLHFFDYSNKYSKIKFWNGDSSSKTRNFGINESDSIQKIASLGILEKVCDINAIPDITSKSVLKEKAEKAGFEIKKTWTLQKIFENLLKTESGQIFLKEFTNENIVLCYNQEYQSDLNAISNYQTTIKRTIDLITML